MSAYPNPRAGRVDRPLISVKDGIILHNGEPCRLVYARDKICVGCSDITPEALSFLFCDYTGKFQPVVRQLAPNEEPKR